MRGRRLALVGLFASVTSLAAFGCTALVQFDDPPGETGQPDATTLPDGNPFTSPDSSPGKDAGTTDGGPAPVIDSGPSPESCNANPCASYTSFTTGESTSSSGYWVCASKRTDTCFMEEAGALGVVRCQRTVETDEKTCPAGHPCFDGGDLEDFCSPCVGVTSGSTCVTDVGDPSFVAYYVSCSNGIPNGYVPCSDSCDDLLGCNAQ